MIASSLTRIEFTRPLSIQVRKEPGGEVLAREPAAPADFADAVSEVWRDGCLRAGRPEVPLADLAMRLDPVLAEGSEVRCIGFSLEPQLPGLAAKPRLFTVHALRPAAERVIERLAAAEVLQPGEGFFEVTAGEDGAEAPAVPQPGLIRSAPLAYLQAALRPLLERSTPVGAADEEAFPVFYTKEALERAEACARRGAPLIPPVETGGALLGSLAACPESGEFFAIVTDVIEVQDAEETTFSLCYSGRSWARLQAILQARQAAYPRRKERLLGQGHGHSFKPNDGKLCAECEKLPVCRTTSVFVSPDDRSWHRAVFARQPWALCHIFGLTARGEPVQQLYGLADGRLQPRGYHLLPDFTCD